VGEESGREARQAGAAAGKWEPGLYVLIESDGFLADWMETELIKRARLLLRTVGGLLTATKLGHVTHQGAHAYAAEGEILVYQKQMDRWVSRRPFRLEADTMQLFRSLQWDDFADLQPENGDWSGWDRLVSRFLRPAFEEREETVLLRRSSPWYFDSLAGTNNLLKFVQATVAIEILLGDKATSDVVGIGELLANRCAYALAKTHSERREMLREFKEIYDTRSQIVHRGKTAFTNREDQQLAALRWFCAGRQNLARRQVLPFFFLNTAPKDFQIARQFRHEPARHEVPNREDRRERAEDGKEFDHGLSSSYHRGRSCKPDMFVKNLRQ
jgi:hypothetical protein